jgi:hypothetical protein
MSYCCTLLGIAKYFCEDDPVAPRSITAEPDDWQRVADAMRARRLNLGIKAEDVVTRSKRHDARGVSLSTYGHLENVDQVSYTERTLRAASLGLGWAPDGITQILKGETPAGTGTEDLSGWLSTVRSLMDMGDDDDIQIVSLQAIEIALRRVLLLVASDGTTDEDSRLIAELMDRRDSLTKALGRTVPDRAPSPELDEPNLG